MEQLHQCREGTVEIKGDRRLKEGERERGGEKGREREGRSKRGVEGNDLMKRRNGNIQRKRKMKERLWSAEEEGMSKQEGTDLNHLTEAIRVHIGHLV